MAFGRLPSHKPDAPMSEINVTPMVDVMLVLLVIWQNSEVTTLSILIFSANLPLMVWLGTFLMIGFLLGVALMWSYRRRT